MGKSGGCNNLKTACSFLKKLATWIDSKVEIMDILLIFLTNINFGCYGNWFTMGKCGFCNNFKNTCCFLFLIEFATWMDSKVENMYIVLICLPNINFGCYSNLKLPLAYKERM